MLEKLLSNHYEGLNQPSSTFIGFCPRYRGQISFCYPTVSVVNCLRNGGFDAVPFFSEDATDITKIVVTPTGIQTPFLKPSEAKEAAGSILECLHKKKFRMNMAFPVHLSQLPVPGNLEFTEQEKDFIDEMIQTAQESEPITLRKIDIQNLETTSSVFRGGTLGGKAYAITANRESKFVAYGSADSITTEMFCCGRYNFTTRSKSKYSKKDKSAYGFLYEFDSNKSQKFYSDYSLEFKYAKAAHCLKKLPECWAESINSFETPIFPHRNPLKQIYLFLSDKEIYKINTLNPLWQRFLDMHEPKANNVVGHMAARRLKQLQDENTAGYSLKAPLEKINYANQRHLSGLAFFQGIFGEDLIQECQNTPVWTEKLPIEMFEIGNEIFSFIGKTGITTPPRGLDMDFVRGALLNRKKRIKSKE